MRDVKRIEIVIDKPHLRLVLDMLRELGAPGYTIFEAVAGYGDRGPREGGEFSDALINRYVLTTCPADRVSDLAAALEPLLRRYGGLCLISDAQLIRND
ncbi:MAG: transcriptional regulator [Planctomycetota bacterium]